MIARKFCLGDLLMFGEGKRGICEVLVLSKNIYRVKKWEQIFL